MAFTTHFSNRVETLAARLMAVLQQALPDPLTAETVLVDNRVMGQWLNLQLAQQQGIAANIRYIQPHELFWTLARAVVSADIPTETPLSKQEMTWRLFGELDRRELLSLPPMQAVRHYLDGDSSKDLKRYQLAAAVADLFDQYLVYRPEWMLQWEAGKPAMPGDANEAWQRQLWLNIARGNNHRAVIEQRLLAALDTLDSDTLRHKIPLQRLAVFGITSMPPRLLDMLMLLGKHIPVDLFVMNPCREYWFDIESAKSLVRKPDKRTLGAGVIGNPLLASQGQQVREFIESLYAKLDQYPFTEDENYDEPGTGSLLHNIQQDILALQYQGGMAELAALPANVSRQPLQEENRALRSVQIHSCHSPLREVEVLHDQLLAMFKQYPALKPRDVVVMMPQVAPYVPYIDTVFGATADTLPYHITDRSWLEEVPLLHSLDVLLGLPDSRLRLTEILALLEVPAVHARFGMDRPGFEKLKNWLRDAGARWGLDASHREQLGLPAYSEFSWEFALNRLLAGYGMATAPDDMPLSLAADSLPVLPFDEVEGSGSALLDSFLQFWDTLLRYRAVFAQPATAEVWAERLANVLDDFFEPQTDDEQLALREIRRQVALLRQANRWCAEPMGLPVVQAVLQPALQAAAHGGHPWREGIKFCSLLPMRGVPFRVVYMLGMNQSDYPKRSTQPGFDLMRHHYQPGDRSRRVDDRWLFLEALLSARDVFHVSYVGRDQRKNEVRQPSVVVAALVDYLRHGYCLPGVDDPDGKQLLQVLTIEHPLQPFSPAYFLADANRQLQSFNTQAFAIASHKQRVATAALPVAAGWPTSPAAVETVDVSLDSFVRFFARPPQWFFRDRHPRVSLKIEDESVSDTEMFELAGGLDAWSVRDALRQLADSMPPGADADADNRVADVLDVLQARWQAEGRWPLGAGGDSLREKLLGDVEVAWLDARRQVAGEPATYSGSCELATPHGTLVVRGELSCLGETLFLHSASNYAGRHRLAFAIQAAFAGAALAPVRRAVAVYRDKTESIPALAARDNSALLLQLAGLYLQYREHGLPFEATLSLGNKTEQDHPVWLQAVADAWHGSQHSEGLCADMEALAYYLCEERLQDDAFLQVARQVKAALEQWQTGESSGEVQP